jgi:triosephosphate isomerase (TIM)
MQKFIIAGNWKMNKSFQEAEEFFLDLVDVLDEKELDNVEVVVCPPAVYLEMATDIAVEKSFSIGAQNCSQFENGAYTGEISTSMLNSMEMDYCIIGHSERRQYFGETDDSVNIKLKKLHEDDILPIVCIGETLEQREANVTKDVIVKQLSGALKDVVIADNVVIAYEPIWAIGTGKTASPDQAQEIHALIRNWVKENYDGDIALKLHILYGGSMKPENIEELLNQPDIDGGLIGGAALDIAKFSSMIETAVRL